MRTIDGRLMAGGYPRPEGDSLGPLRDLIAEIRRRLIELEKPTGTSVASLVAQVQAALATITTTVQNAIATLSYTKAEIDGRIASPGGISPGNVTVGGSITVAGFATVSGPMAVNGQFSAPASYGTTMSTYASAVWNNASGSTGQLGRIPSIRSAKCDITPAVSDEASFRSVEPVRFRYRKDVAENDGSARIDLGFIAEDMREAGFVEALYSDPDTGELQGINYDRLTPILWSMTRQLLDDRDALRWHVATLIARIDALEAQNGAD